MVNGVSGYGNYSTPLYRAAAGAAVVHKNDIENIIRFSNNMPANGAHEQTLTETAVGTLPFLGVIGGIQGLNTLKNNGLSDYALKRFKVLKRQGLAKGWNWSETVKNVGNKIPYKTRTEALKAAKDSIQSNLGNIFKTNLPVAPNTGKIGKLLDKIPGYTKFRGTGFGQALNKSGAGFMAIFEGAIETFTQVVPAFSQLGAGAGFKQIGKSAAKVGASACGWIAGDAAGKAIGAAIGTAICPGIGTAIGTFVGGFIGGMVGSAAAGKVAKAVVGKSELELAQDKQISEVSEQADADPATKIALAQQALEQANTALAQDPQNKDALTAKASAEKILAETIVEEHQAENTTQTTMMPQQTMFQPYMQQMPMMPQQAAGMVFQGVPVVPGFNGYGYDMNILGQAMSQAASNTAMVNQALYPQTANQNINNPFLATAK